MKKLLSLSNTEDIYEILRFLLEWIVLGMFFLLIEIMRFNFIDPSHKLLFTKIEIIPYLLEYAKTSKIHHIRCISCLILISLGYFNSCENDSTRIKIDELLLKSLTEITKVYFLLFNFTIFNVFIYFFL
jgi:hypothetical protein